MRIFVHLALFVAMSCAWGQSLEWDTNLANPGAQGGSGDWDGGDFWWNGTSNVAWPSGADAVFGGSAGTIDSSGITVDDISYTVPDYYLTGILTVGGGDGESLISGTGRFWIGGLAGSSKITKQGSSGIILLPNSGSTFTGGFAIEEGAVSARTLANEGTPSSLGSSGLIALGSGTTSGTLDISSFGVLGDEGRKSTNRPFLINPGGGAISIMSNRTVALTGPLSGTGPLSIPSGRFEVVGDKTFAGTLTVGGFLIPESILALRGSMPAADVVLKTIPGLGLRTALYSEGNQTIADLVCTGVSLLLGDYSANSPARLNTTSLDFNTGSFALDLASPSSYDNIGVMGPVTLGGSIDLTLRLQFDPNEGDNFRIIENDGVDPVALAGGFSYSGNMLEDGEHFTATTGSISQEFEIRYGLTADDNDVRLIATTPEPSSGLLAFGGIAVGFSRTRLGRRPRQR